MTAAGYPGEARAHILTVVRPTCFRRRELMESDDESLSARQLLRKLETMSDERGYQVLDYVEFLESKYAERQSPPRQPRPIR